MKFVTGEELTEAEIWKRRMAVSEADPEHLKAWLKVKHAWLVMNTQELVDALPWPDGIESLMAIIALYANHRRSKDSGRRQLQKEPLTGKMVEIVICKDETLEVEELDRAIRFLTAQIYQLKPDWKLEDAPL